MTPERWQRVKDLFGAALELDAGLRTDFLDAECGTDVELRQEVDSLLVATAGQALVDRPAATYFTGDLLPAPGARMIGRRIGPWEIVALLGRGGMGEVYRARRGDAEYDKEVAIKLVPGGLQAQAVLQRLRAERQILANLDHPNIARLLDGGMTDEGTPYLVLELVEGEPLDRYCATHTTPLRERLRLFRDVCSAVSYAHQRLVVHRDLKPANIFVTPVGEVKLLDFGIAKLQQADGDVTDAPTATVLRALTPGYASPEQILGGAITTASDVYSLGVVLYLLITGRSPYRGPLASTQDAIREVVENDPAAPGSGADLDAIVMRALRKEPAKRYATVEQLSDDIRRFLGGLPVTARGDQFGYRAGKFIRRNKIMIAAASLVAVALIGATFVSLRQARIAEQQRMRAEKHFASVRKLADVFMFQMHDAIRDIQGTTRARQLLMTTALEYLNTLNEEATGDRSLQLDLGIAYRKVADIQGNPLEPNIGDPASAAASYDKAIALLEPLVANDPGDHAAREALAASLLKNSELTRLGANSARSVSLAARGVALYEGLVREAPDQKNRAALANALRTHAMNAGIQGDLVASRASIDKALSIAEALHRQNPNGTDYAHDLSKTLGMAAMVVEAERPDTSGPEVLKLLQRTLELDRGLVESDGKNASFQRTLLADSVNTCQVMHKLADYGGAIEQCRTAEAIFLKMRADPANALAESDGQTLYLSLARALLGSGDFVGAQKTLEANISTLEKSATTADNIQVQFVLAASRLELANTHSRLAEEKAANLETRRSSLRKAVMLYEQALIGFRKLAEQIDLAANDAHAMSDTTKGLARARAALEKT